ncbi:hypothetical protein ACU8DI_01535 [Psychroserpens sp. BH13MA-6]
MENINTKISECDLVLSKIRQNAKQNIKTSSVKHPFNKKELWELFLSYFKSIHGKDFQYTESYMKTKYGALFYYFLGDLLFLESSNLYQHELVPNLNKGLFIVGKVGAGKTAIMETFEKIFFNYKPHKFKIIPTYKVVEEFESLQTQNCRKEFFRNYSMGDILFDDLNSERIANNYGKVNVMKEIIFRRHGCGYKTHFTMNPFPGLEHLPEQNLLMLADFYDARVADRLFEMCNYINIDGKSKRV